MTFPDISTEIAREMPDLRGRLTAGQPLAPFTWFRVGGLAQLLFSPADEQDLSYFLTRLRADIPVTQIGFGSNLIVRDGGIAGVTIRLGGKAFAETAILPDHRIAAGAAVSDLRLATAAAEAGIAGLAFYRGIPGSVGGALRMNAGAHGGETRDFLVEATGVARDGTVRSYSNAQMGFSYRHCSVPEDVIFTRAVFQGRAGDPAAILAEMDEINARREATQPIREKTGGSTFKNPPGESAWKLIDAAGCRGLVHGHAQVSDMHCNFLINRGGASAAEIEALGEEVRRRVKETSGVELQWEIRRVGVPAPGVSP